MCGGGAQNDIAVLAVDFRGTIHETIHQNFFHICTGLSRARHDIPSEFPARVPDQPWVDVNESSVLLIDLQLYPRNRSWKWLVA